MTDAAASAPKKPRGAYAKTAAKRRAILDSALEVFAQSGYRAGSLRDIAARVGMSEAGLLHHFPGKAALLAAVLERRDEHSADRVPLDAADGIATLRALVNLAAYNASVPGVVQLYCTLSAEATSPGHPAHDYFVRRYEWARSTLAQAFEQISRDGSLSEGIDPTLAAVATIAMMDGLQVQWLLDREVVDMADALREFFKTLVDVDI